MAYTRGVVNVKIKLSYVFSINILSVRSIFEIKRLAKII